jgi:sec-independent protein translocase protein TatB
MAWIKLTRQASHLPGAEAEGYHCGMNLGMSEMIFIFIAALILVGPKKLPEIMRQVGKWMAEFKRASNEFKWQIETEMRNLELETERSKQTILPPVVPPQGTIANGAAREEPAALTNGAPDRHPTEGEESGSDESSTEHSADSAKSVDA